MGDPTELLTLLEISATKHRRKVENNGWAWRKGVEIYIAPESRCSFCNATFETNRVYLLDTLNNLVPRQWRLADGLAVKQHNKLYHPHAFHTNGGVCMNMADTLPQLIFNSINTNANYNANLYFWDVGHECPKERKAKCPFCGRKVPQAALRFTYGKELCSLTCVEDARRTRCARCFDERQDCNDDPDGFGPYCKSCSKYVKVRMTLEERNKRENPDDG